MIKLPSLRTLSESLTDTIIRYKWVTLIALIKTIILICLTETPYDNHVLRNLLTRLSFVFTLALPLMLAIWLSDERRPSKPYLRAVFIVLLGLILAIYYVTMDSEPNQNETYRFVILLAGAHLLVSYSPFIGFNDKEGFWQFNKTLFLQFLNATLYAATLYIGLLIALQTVKYLFGITYTFSVEMDLFIAVSSFFHTIFFLSKIPKITDIPDSYPNGLKVFTQYVLLPLEVVYLVILYAYMSKIIVQWQLPQGRVAYLVLAFSVAGIFALLLLYPLRQSSKERWVTIFSRRYYLALLPLIALLFTGIFRRVDDYGITENRYIVGILAFWLAGITVYFLSGKRDDIRWIPISLSILCFLLPIGPWNIFVVSKNSQLKQFRRILSENKVLNANNQIAKRKIVTEADRDQLVSIVKFFRDRELAGLEPYFAGFNGKNKSDYQYYSAMESDLDKYVVSDKTKKANTFTNFSPQFSKSGNGMTVNEFDHMIFVDANEDKVIGDGQVDIKIENFGKSWTLQRDNRIVKTWNVADKVKSLQFAFGSHSMEVPQDSLVFVYGSYKMVFRSLSSNGNSYYGHGILLYK